MFDEEQEMIDGYSSYPVDSLENFGNDFENPSSSNERVSKQRFNTVIDFFNLEDP